MLLLWGYLAMTDTVWRPRAKFFKDLTGLFESDFQQDRLARTCLVDLATGRLQNRSSGRSYQTGRFRVVTLRQLRAETQGQRGSQPGKFSVFFASQPSRESHYRRIDVGALQADPQNQRALFQVASNFNALELCSPSDKYQMEHLEQYIFDNTQGPNASISAAAALVLRHYYAFAAEGVPIDEWPQKFSGRQLELLGQTGLPVKNGYLVLTPETVTKELDPQDVAVCLHEEAEVTFGLVRQDEHEVVQRPQFVDQVFTATVDLAGANAKLAQSHPQELERIGRALLRAAYEGTLRCAQLRGNKQVFLTLIGGGVFANPPKWISDTLLALKDLIVDSGIDVQLNLYRTTPSGQSWTRPLTELVEHTGGRWVDVSFSR